MYTFQTATSMANFFTLLNMDDISQEVMSYIFLVTLQLQLGLNAFSQVLVPALHKNLYHDVLHMLKDEAHIISQSWRAGRGADQSCCRHLYATGSKVVMSVLPFCMFVFSLADMFSNALQGPQVIWWLLDVFTTKSYPCNSDAELNIVSQSVLKNITMPTTSSTLSACPQDPQPALMTISKGTFAFLFVVLGNISMSRRFLKMLTGCLHSLATQADVKLVDRSEEDKKDTERSAYPPIPGTLF